MKVGMYYNPEAFEYLPNARLNGTAQDVFHVLLARQDEDEVGLVRIKQTDLAERLGVPQSNVSRAMNHLRDAGLIHPRTTHGKYLLHPLYAGYKSEAHMINHLREPSTYIWPLNFPSGDTRQPRSDDPRKGTDFEPNPDPDGGEPAQEPENKPYLYLATAS